MHVLLDGQKTIGQPDINQHPLLQYLLSIKDEIPQWARPRLIEPATAEEAFGDIYLRCYIYCRKYGCPTNHPAVMRSFISRALANYCIDQNRRLKLAREELTETIPDVAAQHLLDDVVNNKYALLDVIGQLPQPYRDPVWLYCVENLPAKEGAELLGVSVPAFKSRLYRGRNVLRKNLGSAYPFMY